MDEHGNPAVLLGRAQGGDGDAFQELTGPYRYELLTHCYRMLGSLQDAEDALQETLLAAWQGLGRYEERASLRTWLYRIATNRCLNARRATRRRPPKEWDVPGVRPPEPSRLGEVVWLEPFPDESSPADSAPGPEARYDASESISLAFIAALQLLPPRQLAVLVLRDVLGFRAAEVAEMLEATEDSVTSLLKRARATLRRQQRESVAPPPSPGSSTEQAIVAEFARAYEASDVDAIVALLTDDVFMAMPPMPLEYEGTTLVAEFLALLFGAGRRYQLVATRANGQPAFASYIEGPDGAAHSTGLFVLALAGNRIAAMTRFENTVLPWFGMPRSLPISRC